MFILQLAKFGIPAELEWSSDRSSVRIKVIPVMKNKDSHLLYHAISPYMSLYTFKK